MFGQLLRFEWDYLTKQVSFIVFVLLFLAFGFLITADSLGQGMALFNANAPYRLSYFIALVSVMVLLPCMILCVNMVLRDKEYNFDGITSNLAIEQQLLGRIFMIFLAGLLLFVVLAFGLWLGLMSPKLDQSTIGHFHMSHYAWPWLIFALPNVFICTTLLFFVTTKWQHALVTYLVSLGLFSLFWLSALTIGAPIAGTPVMADNDILTVFSLLDPFGTSAFFQQTQFWTPQQKNQQLISFDGLLLVNRVLWLSIACLVLIQSRKSWRKPLLSNDQSQTTRLKTLLSNLTGKTQRSATTFPANKADTANTDKQPDQHAHLQGHHRSLSWFTPATTSLATQLKTFNTMLAFEVNKIITDWPFHLILLLWSALVLAGAIGFGSGGGEFSGNYPTTSLLTGFVGEPLIPMALVFVIYYCGEKIWQERLLKMDSLIDSSPVENTVSCGAKLLSLAVIPVSMIFTLIVISISYQAFNGFYQFETGHYISLFYFFGLPVFIQTIWLMFIQTLIANSRYGNKYLGLAVSGLTLVLFANLTTFTGLEHPLLQFNQLPSLLRVHTDLNGYGLYASQFHWFAALWSATAMIIFVLTVRNWRRDNSSATSK